MEEYGVQDMLLLNMAPWCIEYLKFKEFGEMAQIESSL